MLEIVITDEKLQKCQFQGGNDLNYKTYPVRIFKNCKVLPVFKKIIGRILSQGRKSYFTLSGILVGMYVQNSRGMYIKY